MNHAPQDLDRNASGTLLPRFALTGAVAGLLIGVYEGALLSFRPHVLALRQPDAGYVIWFLAPLVDMILFGLLGLALGAMAARRKPSDPINNAVLAAVGLGLAGAFALSIIHLFHVQVRDLRVDVHLTYAVACFLVALVFAGGMIFLAWDRVGGFFNEDSTLLLKPAARPLVVATAVAVAGIGYFLAARDRTLTTAKASASSNSPPNIVLITLDTVRADHLSAYGYSRPTTPNLEHLARQGVLFENAFAATSWTLASHASIFTGLLPHQHGADWAVPVASGPWTLAEVLKAYGYETAGFTSNLYYGQRGWGMAQGFEVYGDDSTSIRHNFGSTLAGRALVQPVYQTLGRYDLLDRRDAREVNHDVLRWYRHRSSRPFFLFINYFDAHLPYQAPSPFNHRFGKAPDKLLERIDHLIGHDNQPRRLSAAEQASLAAAYDNCLVYLDDQVGYLVKELERTHEYSNTIFIFTSDHGEGFGEHGRYSHGWDLHREEIHVPLILIGPGIPSGARVTHIARTRDIFSTVLDFALQKGVPFSQSSLRRFWTPGFTPAPFDEIVVSELIPVGASPSSAEISLMTSEWHFIHHADRKEKLYRWTTDPQEQADLSRTPEGRGTMNELRARLEDLSRHSLEPWLGPAYLEALDHPGYSFLSQCVLADRMRTNASEGPPRVGRAQAYFVLEPNLAPVRPKPAVEELLKSLPYR